MELNIPHQLISGTAWTWAQHICVFIHVYAVISSPWTYKGVRKYALKTYITLPWRHHFSNQASTLFVRIRVLRGSRRTLINGKSLGVGLARPEALEVHLVAGLPTGTALRGGLHPCPSLRSGILKSSLYGNCNKESRDLNHLDTFRILTENIHTANSLNLKTGLTFNDYILS